MNIAIMSHDNKKDLMVQFCTAYAGILSRHNLFATNTTGHMVADATGLDIHCCFSCAHGGAQQIGARISYNEIDLVLFFNDPNSSGQRDGQRRAVYLPSVRPQQHPLCQQHRHRRNAGAGPGPG